MIPSGNDMALLFTDGTIVYVEDFFLPIDMLGNTAAIEFAGQVYTTSDFETSLQAAFVDTAPLPEGFLNVEPLEFAPIETRAQNLPSTSTTYESFVAAMISVINTPPILFNQVDNTTQIADVSSNLLVGASDADGDVLSLVGMSPSALGATIMYADNGTFI